MFVAGCIMVFFFCLCCSALFPCVGILLLFVCLFLDTARDELNSSNMDYISIYIHTFYWFPPFASRLVSIGGIALSHARAYQ